MHQTISSSSSSSSYSPSTRFYISPPGSVASPASSASSWGTLPTQPPSFSPLSCPPSVYSPSYYASPAGSAASLPPSINPIIQHGGPRYDVRVPPANFSNQTMLAFPSSSVIVTHVRIFVNGPGGVHPENYFDVQNRQGITVLNVYSDMYHHFQKPIHRDLASREANAYFVNRTRNYRDEYLAGAKMLDALCGRVTFDGLKPYGNSSTTLIAYFA
ncbi:hypothetical protein Hypma_016178 [Hypsizygus marmoreus]|uniref:DUF6699 domain-containing protein n=1 Tax=Hypsizygus marmoreus TaxID=39966 RepID=A0A369J633_HYPMA|nr:hypothetical protein Hypma_016178 [Hypsizygus marmoreus]